jgi:hypothetical protein|tara:strand:+ start:133131 stop:133361 length:231 start_codon:yes stop_codon:yes gene_type:complete
MTNMPDEPTAKSRFLRMSAVRIFGMVLVILGMQIWLKDAFGYQDEMTGKLVAVLGVACMFLVPAMLRRHWRQRDGR